MSDPNNGTYPQAAGSFYNSSAMMPHSGGRVAPQVPTYGEGLPGLMNASRMQISNPNTPRGTSVLASRSANMEAYYRAQDSSIGTATTGLNVMSGITAVGGFFGATLLANPITGLGLGVGMAMASSALDRFAKEKEKIRSVQNALSGLNLVGNSMGDSLTGSINYSSATQISNSIHSRVGGFKSEDLKGVMDYAAKTGALTGYTNNHKQLTDRIVQLAKVTKEIVDIGDGITAADAANMQTMLSGMGINANTISKKSIGKRLVMAGRTAGLSLEEVNNLAQTSGQAYVQMGLSATQGVLAGAHAASSAKTLMGIGTLSEKDISKLGGQAGLQQGLFKAGSASMSNLSQRLIMGTMKMSDKGEMIIDQDLLDMAVSGKISLEDLDARANKQMKRISKLDSRNRKLMMEQIQRSMPDLAEQVSENINAEQQMTLAGRGIQELRDKGMSTKSAMESFFGGDQQAIKAFTEYAKNLPSILQEQKRQNYLAEQDKLLARASQSIDYSELHSDNALTRTFKAISDDYDYAVNLVFDPEGRARRSLMREEKNKYRNLGFANGINDNSILSNILRNNGITRNAYTLTTEDLMQFSGRELNTAISTKATGDIFSSNLLQGDTFNTLSSNANIGYSLKDFENQELIFTQTGGRSQYYGSVMDKNTMEQIAADAAILKKKIQEKISSEQALSATDYTKGDITFNKDLNTFSVRRRVGDADFTELGGYNGNGEFMMTNKAGVAGGIGRFLTIDPSLDPEDPSNRSKPLSGLLNDILYEDTEDILGIGYGDRFMDIRNKLKGEYYDSGTLEMTSKLFGGNYFDSDATAEDAVTTITKAGRSYLKMFGENNNTLEANKAKLNLDIRGWNNTVEGNRKKDAYLNLRKRLSRRIEEQTTSTFSSTDDLSSLNYEAVEDMLKGEHLSPEEKQAMIQMVLKDIKDGTYDSQFGAVGSNVKRGAAKVEEAFQLAASVTKLEAGLDNSKLTKLAVDLGSEFTELNKVFDNREGSNEQLRKLMALVTTGEGDKVNTSNMQEMLRDLAARGINLTKKQAAAAAAFLQKTSGVRAGGKQNKEDLDKLFDMLNKGGNDISVKDNIESLISAGNTAQFLQEAKSYAEQGNELSKIVVKSIEAKNSDTNINATSDMGAKLITSGRTIRQLMGAEYDSLSEQQKNEISRMESKANRETNPDIKANSLGRAVALAQQYMQQNQANQTGEGGSKSLPAVMTEISQGITTFNDTMTQLKNALSNQGSTMTITLNK